MIRGFAEKHMKSNVVKLDQELNRHVWKKGKANPPRRLRVRMTKDEDGVVIVSPYEEVIRKDSDKSEAIDEQAELEPAQEPLPDTEKVQDGRTKMNSQIPKKKTQRNQAKARKKQRLKKTKGKKTKK